MSRRSRNSSFSLSRLAFSCAASGCGGARPRGHAPVRSRVGPARSNQVAFRASSQFESCCKAFPNKIYLANEGKVYAMASADRRIKSVVFLDAPEEDDLVEGILKGVEDYKAGRVKNFKSKEELLHHLKSL